MIRIRPEVASINPYIAGRTTAAVAAEIGLEESAIVKLASNEAPEGPFPGVSGAIAKAADDANRYPDNAIRDLAALTASHHGIEPENLWFAAGSSSTLREVALAVGGPGTSAVFPDPSFVIYQLATKLSGATGRPVALDGEFRVDLDRLLSAIDATTTVIYVCNPNNPTGTVNATDDTRRFLDAVPDDVLVVVDEAYEEYVTDPEWQSMIPEAVRRPNVVVTRTFSKIFALAALRVGYAVGMPGTLAELRKAQAPFTVTTVAQAAAAASLKDPTELARRRAANAAGRRGLESGLADRSIGYIPSHANFVYLPMDDPGRLFAEFQQHGVITRSTPGGLRVSVGTDSEMRQFFAVLDKLSLA